MLIPKYWSPKYFKDKLMVILYETIKPRDPWLVKEANLFLDKHLNHTHNLLEFGAGKSTLWFSPRVKNIISFEHNPKWHQKIANKISTNKLINIDYRLSTPNTYTYEN